jgi:hypothetical protein
MVWYGMVWYGMVWYGMVWYGMVGYDMIWYDMIYDMNSESPYILRKNGYFTEKWRCVVNNLRWKCVVLACQRYKPTKQKTSFLGFIKSYKKMVVGNGITVATYLNWQNTSLYSWGTAIISKMVTRRTKVEPILKRSSWRLSTLPKSEHSCSWNPFINWL